MKEKIYKKVALTMCALLVSLSVAGTYTVPVSAAGTVTHASLYKVIDMALAKTGIVANSDIITSIQGTIWEEYLDIINQYEMYLQDTFGSLENVSADTFNDFLESAGIVGNAVTDTIKYAIALSLDLWSVTIEEFADLFIDVDVSTGIQKGVGYKISDEAVEYIRNTFDDYAESEADFYYIDTVGPDDIHPGWFPSKTTYDNFVTYLSESPYVVFLEFMKGTTGSYFSTTSKNSASFTSARFHVCFDGVHLIHDSNNGSFASEFYRVNAVNDEWNNLTTKYRNSYISEYTFESFEELSASLTTPLSQWTWVSKLEREMTGTDTSVGFCTNDGRKMKVFKDMSTMKLYNVGQQSYYLVQENDYSTTNDNSVSFTGDYYENNSDSYSYDIVQNEIDNSTEINEETVNNIVNTSTTTIINNYYTTPEGDDSGSGDSSGSGGTGEGLAGLLGSIGGFLDFLLGLIGSVVELLTTFLNSALTLIGSLGSIFGNFGSLLGDLFSFIPQELIDAIVSGMMLLIFLAVYKAAKN